jgi:ornithine--oxo-acid transaminase
MHGSPWQTRAIDLAGININFDRADGIVYSVGRRRYVDLASGAGPAFRGHNQQAAGFVTTAGTVGNESSELEAKLGELTGLPLMLPAVSGASSVDNAVLAALCARPGRNTIVTIHGNYSGKGPLSLALSRTSAHFRDRDHEAFRPYPVRIVEVAINDIPRLREILQSDGIALVWMEPVQGLDCVPLPKAVINEVVRWRDSAGYLIGVDEILTGFWRASSDRFTTFAEYGIQPDIAVLSKALSDALIPIGATMISTQLFDEMRTTAPDTAEWLRSHYRNDLGAALALAAIEAAICQRGTSGALEAALDAALVSASKSAVFAGYRRAGLLGRLLLSPQLVGKRPDPLLIDHFECLINRLVTRRCGIITLQMRLLPCTSDVHSAETISALNRLGDFLGQLTRRVVYKELITSSVAAGAREIKVMAIALRERLNDTVNQKEFSGVKLPQIRFRKNHTIERPNGTRN